MSAFAPQQLRLAVVLCAAAMAGACSVADSFHVDTAGIDASGYSPAVPTLCRSALGSYALPKTFLKVTVSSTAGAAPDLVPPPAPVVRADKSLTFCLDHIADPLADDDIRIIKASGQLDPSYGELDPKKADPTKVTLGQYTDAGNKDYGSQILQWVVSNTVDQSEYIAKTLVRTAFIGLSGKAGFTPLGRANETPGQPAPATIIVSFEYDPFDPAQSALHNQTLRDLGYCLVLENFTFDTRVMTAEQYCNAPRYLRFPFDEAYARYRSGPPPRIAGIAYRPRISYALSIYKNDNPKGRGRWRLSQRQRVPFENIAPIVSIGLNRSIFAARRVALKFNMGALEAMCLVKTSELESAVTVPYEIAKSIVALPTQVFEVKIGNASDNIELLKAESSVVKAQQDYLGFLADATKSTFTNPNKNEVVPLPTKDSKDALPNPIAITVDKGIVGNADSLKSDVLDQICQNAPSVIAPTPRKAGGVP